MSDCECLSMCPFFNDKIEAMPALIDMFKRQFCQGDSSHCARHIVFAKLGRGAVPMDLFPNHTQRANNILRDN